METFRTKLSRKEFDRYQVLYPSNLVIVEMSSDHDILTVGGIKVNFNEDTLYAEGEESHVADMATVHGVIVKQVDRLYFNAKDTIHTMPYDTDIETQIGDTVWFHPLIAKNCNEVIVDSTLYKVIPYYDLFVAKRGDEVICLNGNVVLEEMYVPKLSVLDVSPPKVDKERGIVRFNGTDNRRYETTVSADMPNLKEGDVVIIDRKTYIYYLERSKWNTNFDEGKMYIVIQKKHILGVL